MKFVLDIDTDNPYTDKNGNKVYVATSGAIYEHVVLNGLEPLTTEYINEHFSDLHEGEYEVAYQKGLDDAWEAFKKLLSMWLNDYDAMFAEDSFLEFTNKVTAVTASEAIAKVTEYEKEKKDHLKRDIQQDIDTLMSSTGMTIEEIADALKQMKGGAE